MTPSSGVAALSSLCAVARFHQIASDPATLAHQMGIASTDAVTTADLLGAAKHLGCRRASNIPQQCAMNEYSGNAASLERLTCG
ncbi:hypothetical protein [Rhodoferax sp.]|uniref:hypothetical protein n=1 Tax=Rhodoferax sp. TaxID=50421 RepID=UPI002ACDAFC8|nr:hypothetical protein [Rhodoferax sp.]MDZ7920654.1 hypothetical protein [Rhodoferax sp.]